MAKAKKKSRKFSVINELHDAIVKNVTVTRTGEARMKRSDLKKAMEEIFATGAKMAAAGDRVRFPIIGALAMREVKARKAGKGTNPFTGEPMDIKARPASRKPRWSFPKSMREMFGNKRNW